MSADDVTAEWITRPGARLGYLVRPREGHPTAALLVVHEAFGLPSEIVRYPGLRPGFVFPSRKPTPSARPTTPGAGRSRSSAGTLAGAPGRRRS
jgi:hypothetical protein